MDGRTPAREIATALHEAFGQRVGPAEERLRVFLTRLYRGDLIRYMVKT
jgi:hypothetical protein